MNYYLFKLQFTAPVHFGFSDSALSLYTSGDHFYADTLFSALCHTAVVLYGPEGAGDLCRWVQDGKLCLSDSMPWCADALYLPKPCISGQSSDQLPARLRKKIKQLQWIGIGDFARFADSIQGKGFFQPDQPKFGVFEEQVRAAIGDEARPYRVGIYRFLPDCGLYILAGCQNDHIADRLLRLLEGLGFGGIGGKVSSGCGNFTVSQSVCLDQGADAQLQWLNQRLRDREAHQQLLLTTSLPEDRELETALENASYQVIRRGGFASLREENAPRKKQTQYFLAAGAVLHNRFCGGLYDVCPGQQHPVYRYSVPVFLGVTL